MAGKSESVGGVYKGEHISVSKKIRQNDSCIVGETWELIPNTVTRRKGQGIKCTNIDVK